MEIGDLGRCELSRNGCVRGGLLGILGMGLVGDVEG